MPLVKTKFHYSASEIKEFRAYLGKLKQQGLIPDSVDVRRALPSDRVSRETYHTGTKYHIRDSLRELVNKYSDVAEGTAVAIKAPKKIRKDYKDRYQVSQDLRGAPGRVIVPKRPDQKVKLKNGRIQIENPNRVTTYQIADIPFHDIEQYMRDLRAADLEAPEGTYFGFNFYGGHSHRLFARSSWLADFFERYKFWDQGARVVKSAGHHFEIVTVGADKADTDKWFEVAKTVHHRKKTERQKAKQRAAMKKWRDNLPEWRKAEIRERNRLANRKRRAAMTEAQKEKARKRNKLAMRKKRKG